MSELSSGPMGHSVEVRQGKENRRKEKMKRFVQPALAAAAALAIWITGVWVPWTMTLCRRGACNSVSVGYDWFTAAKTRGYGPDPAYSTVARGVGFSIDYPGIFVMWGVILALYCTAAIAVRNFSRTSA
jgi:hypothetical protein